MKIAFNPSTVAALTTPPNNKDITFDLRGRNIFARGVKFYGTDTNTWRDIKINNVSIGSHTLDLRNGSNTTLTNTNGVVTINSTWRPVVDNLTSDSTTSSLSAKQGKVLKALIDGKSNSDHNHDGRYLKLTGGTMASNALITFADSGSWDTDKGPQGARGGLYWTGQSDYAKLYAEETVGDNLDLVIQFGDDNSNGLSIRNKANTQTSYISSSGVITTGTFKGNLDWSYITNKPATATRWPSWAEVTGKPSSFTPSTHTHDYLVVNSADDKSFNSAYHNFQVLYAGGGNGITGKPANVDAFGLFKFRAASGWSGQMLLANGGSLYIRSSEDAKMTNTLAWKTILDSSNYSGILDSRYYTESEVNSLLDAKLNRQNLSYGTWNPRGWNLAADYHYNGGDLSISENNGKMYVSVDGCFWQNEGQYRVLDTSDIGDIRDSVTLHQYLSATDAAWYPLVWGGASHNNTSDSTGPVYKSHDKLSWQTSRQTLYATNIQTNNIKSLSIGGGIYWNPNVEATTDNTDAASITLVRSGVAGGTTLVLSQMNDTNDTIQFKTNTAARLYHNSYPILTTQNTYVNNNKGYINGTEITQVNNSDTLDGAHLSDIKNWSDRTASAYWKAGWYKVASAQTATNIEAFLTLDVNAVQSKGHATLFIRKRADSKPYFICTHNNNLNLADFRLYYNGMSMVLYARVPNDWNGRVFRIISEGREGTYEHIWTLYRNASSTDPNAISAEGGNPYINPTYSGRVDWSNSSDKANYANSAGSVAWNNVTGKPSEFNPAAHTHTVFKNNLMIKGTNGISDSASIHLGIGDSDTGFKWISDGVCQIYADNAVVGQWTSGGMNWFINPTVNGNKVWNAGNDGSGSGLDADTLDGEHASSFVRAGHYESNDLNKLDTYSFIRSVNSNVSSTSPKGNTGWYNVIQLVHRNGASDGPSYIGQIALGMTTNTNDMFFRGKRTDPWKTVIHSGNYTEFINNYYWANVKISTSSSTTTSPTVSNLTATNSIRLGDIHLEYTNEINSYGGLLINYRSSADVDLCQGGGNVCIGATLPTQKLDVRGNIITKGLGIQPYYLSKSVLLPTIRLDDGYTYKYLEISATTEISCIIADRAGLMSERGILIKFNKGYDGQIILLKDLQSYGSGNGYFWVMPSGCKIISADNSSILVGQNQISNTYDDGRSRFLVYSSVYSVWIEFLCSNTF